jgi:hypothetical protein
VVAPQLVVRADLLRGQVDAVLVARDRPDRDRARRLGADVDLVRDAGGPAEQFALPEDRDDRLDVGVVDVPIIASLLVKMSPGSIRGLSS